MSNISTKILKRVSPGKKDKNDMEEFSNVLLQAAGKIGRTYNAKPMLCGSVAKNTWLKDKKDLDLFFLFNPLVSKKKLGDYGFALGKEIMKKFKGKYRISYAEHPYVTGTIKYKKITYNMDIVPCYNLHSAEKIKSAVDRTPFHVRYVMNNLKNPDEVRLLKQFCFANDCYGADVVSQGFSGYLCELLIIAYGSFGNVIKEASNWRAGTKVKMKNVPMKKFNHPLTVIDPVDHNRNVAAALSPETFYKFVRAATLLKIKPTDKFFFSKKTKTNMKEITKEMRKRGTKWYILKMEKPETVDDILYPQMRRFMKSIDKMLTESGFRTLRKDFFIDKQIYAVFEMEIWLVPKTFRHYGPNVYSRHAEQFLKHYKNRLVMTEGGMWVLENERSVESAYEFIKKIKKTSKKKQLEMGIPSKIAPLLKKSTLYHEKKVVDLISKNSNGFKIFMNNWFKKDLNPVF